ncbi:hypothetical protein BDF20DRAFT_887764 [Mycotypha africana]|uniref:uncharacterized protein n=1 Tax=Mycotypha africana TaxID=64632 RepID=UPI002300F86C|nr:uncharacterized protein BDF20DRAFT_887764 [Mycotypha africana]KAI8971988.1 hypothetical protein BDF20DRAFT_887764 [Mycotypha africana]
MRSFNGYSQRNNTMNILGNVVENSKRSPYNNFRNEDEEAEEDVAAVDGNSRINDPSGIIQIDDGFIGFDMNDNYGENYSETDHATLNILDKNDVNSYSVLSLKEMSLRHVVLKASRKDGLQQHISHYYLTSIFLLPEHIQLDMQQKVRFCPQCQGPFIYEWRSTVQFRTVQGYPSPPHQVRFCGSKCMKKYSMLLEQKYLAAQSNVTLPNTHENPTIPEPGSFDWIMMAVSAASAQEEGANTFSADISE